MSRAGGEATAGQLATATGAAPDAPGAARAPSTPGETGETGAPCEPGGTGETVLYETTVVATGPLVADFREQGIVILFGEQAPEELWDLAVRHRPRTAVAGPVSGDVVEIDGTRLPVLAVGSVVADNLLQLGHLDLKADGRSEPTMPGDLCVPETDLPLPVVGSVIRLLRPVGEHGGGAP